MGEHTMEQIVSRKIGLVAHRADLATPLLFDDIADVVRLTIRFDIGVSHSVVYLVARATDHGIAGEEYVQASSGVGLRGENGTLVGASGSTLGSNDLLLR